MALAAVGMVVAACGEADDLAGSNDPATTTTTAPVASSTTTTSGSSGAGPGEACEGETPIWAFGPLGKAQEPPDDCVEPTPEPEPELGTGDVQITLRWESSADLDLHVVEPDGTEIWFMEKGPTATGGQLDVDSNIGCEQEASVENVFWPPGDMPLGSYRVEVVGFQVEGCGGGDYTLTAEVEGESVLDEAGTVGEDEVDSFDFEA